MNTWMEGKQSILLFDGECNFCNGWVDFILKRERDSRFKFASLQSDIGLEITAYFRVPPEVDSLIAVVEGEIYFYSDAVMQALVVMPIYLRWLRIFRFLPKGVRDGLYKQVARMRYVLMGKRETCRIPSAEERVRFLE